MLKLQAYFLLGLLGVVATAGCGSAGLSQNDLKRMAIKRDSDDEDDDDESGDDNDSGQVNADTSTVGTPPADDSDPGESAAIASAGHRTAKPPKVDTQGSGNHAQPKRLGNASTANLPVIGQVAATPEETPELAISDAPLAANATTAERLARLGAAIDSYAKRHNRFPSQAIKKDGQPLLSWRVELLPYLGYTELYTKFQFDESWDSPKNQSLLEQIPIEFHCGNGTKTQVLAIQGGSPLIAATSRPTSLKRVLDGPANTIAAVEVDISHAVPWTQPEDMGLPKNASTFCALDAMSFWAVFGDGSVHEIARDIERLQLNALFSYDDETGITPTQVAYSGTEEATTETTSNTSNTAADAGTPIARRKAAESKTPATDSPYQRTPDAAALAEANDSLRAIYQDRYKRAKEREERIDLAREMLAGAQDLASDPPAQFALLRLAANIAAENADLSLVQKTVEMRVKQFPEWDELTEYGELLQTVYKSGKKTDRKLADLAVKLADRAMDEGSFKDADAMGGLAANVHKSARTEKHPDTYMRMKRRLNEFRGWRGRVNSAMETLAKDEDDGNANLIVGRFYCFFRGRWEDGLPLLARGDDTALKRLAELELYDSGALEQEVQLGDEWWTTGEKVSTYRRDYHLRAYHWYSQAIESGAGGVNKLRAEVRIKDVEERYLDDEQ